MSILTVLLIAVFFAVWKTPRWVKGIGNFALVFGMMTSLIPLYHFLSTLQKVALEQSEGIDSVFDLVSPGVFFGVKAILIPVIYGMIIYLISLVVRMVRKPRIQFYYVRTFLFFISQEYWFLWTEKLKPTECQFRQGSEKEGQQRMFSKIFYRIIVDTSVYLKKPR